MGQIFTAIWDRLQGNMDCRILMVGLDAAGKTTTLYKLKLGEVVKAIPTVGFNVETVTYKNISFQCWDIGGQTILRDLWRHYYNGTNGIIFIVDSSDRERIDIARDTLHMMLQEEELKGASLLVYANKQDQAGCMSCPEITDRLQLTAIKGRNWYI